MSMNQQGSRDNLTKYEMQRLLTPPKEHMVLKLFAGTVQLQSKSKSSVQRKGKFLQVFLTQALHGPVCASASGSTGNRDLLTSQALLVSQCKVLLLSDYCFAAKNGYYT